MVGHVITCLKTIPNESIHAVITSPPYFGLRSYSTDPQVWGGDPDCDHEWGAGLRRTGGSGLQGETSQRQGRSNVAAQELNREQGSFCIHCGAWRGELGQEPTLAMFIDHLVDVFREVKRVLRPDGVAFVNMGDSYCSGSRTSYDHDDKLPQRMSATRPKASDGLKPKDLMLVPARLAIALVDDGWYLRSDIIWSKAAPMPESCRDRPTSAHEHIFLLTKQPKYFYDIDAVRQPLTESSVKRLTQDTFDQQTGGDKDYGTIDGGNKNSMRKALNNQREKLVAQEKWKSRHEGWEERDKTIGANLRNVWHLGPEPFPDAHFATFVTEIPRRCIKAGTSEYGCCSNCGSPWQRRTQKEFVPQQDVCDEKRAMGSNKGMAPENGWGGTPRGSNAVQTLGWEPTCRCDAGLKPCTVLDPFLGSGTTLMVADQLGRNGIGIELNPTYAEMARKRISGDAPMFANVQVSPPQEQLSFVDAV